MLALVTEHGDTTTNLISAPTLLTNSVAHDLTVDTGLQPMVVAPRALPLLANSQEVATSVPQSSTPAPLAREATGSKATAPDVASSNKRLKLASLALLFLLELGAGVASPSSAMAELGTL